jgi:hypothetical protein
MSPQCPYKISGLLWVTSSGNHPSSEILGLHIG